MGSDLRTTPHTTGTSMQARGTGVGRTLSIIGFVSAVLALFILPIVFGPAAIVLGIIGYAKGDKLGLWAAIAGVVGLVGGIALGMAAMDART